VIDAHVVHFDAWRSPCSAFGLIKLGRCQREIAFRLILAQIEIISSVTSTVSMSSCVLALPHVSLLNLRVFNTHHIILLLLLFTKLPLSLQVSNATTHLQANVSLPHLFRATWPWAVWRRSTNKLKQTNTERSTRTQLKPMNYCSNNGNHHRFPLLEPAGERQIIRLKKPWTICAEPGFITSYHTH